MGGLQITVQSPDTLKTQAGVRERGSEWMRECVTHTAERAEMPELGAGNFIPGKGRPGWLTPALVQAPQHMERGTAGGKFLRKPHASKPANGLF